MSIRIVKIVEKAVIWISATILLYLFTNAKSPLYIVNFLPHLSIDSYSRARIDLSFLMAPFTVLFIFLFASSVSSMLAKQSPLKDVIRKVLYGLAISAFILVLFLWAPIPAFTTAILFPLELVVIVFTVSTVAIGLLEYRKRYEPLLVTLCTGVVAYAIYDIARSLSQVYEPIVHIALPFTVGILAVSVGSLFGLLRDTDKFVLSKISEWISEEPIRNFTFIFSLTIYVNFARPTVEDFPPIVIGEWITIAIVMAVIVNVAKGSSKELYTDSEFLDWKKHTTEAQRQTGLDFENLVSAQEKFVNQGRKETLLVYLTLTLRDLGKTEDRILITLAPLVHYRDKKPSFWKLRWTKGKLEKENKEARRKLIEGLSQEIEKGG